MPVWLLALQIALTDAPAIVQAIQVANLPPMSEDEMKLLRVEMNKAIAAYDAATLPSEAAPRGITASGPNLEL